MKNEEILKLLSKEEPLNQENFRLLLQLNNGVQESAMVDIMITIAKKNYVKQNHERKIFHMEEAQGYKKGKWKTYIYEDGKRKGVVTNTEEELYERLFEYYSSLDNSNKTLEDVFELLCKYKRDCLNRSLNTIQDDRTLFRLLSTELRDTPIREIDDEMIRKWIVSDYVPKRPKISRFKKTLQLIDQVFKFGIIKKHCIENPMTYILAKEYFKFCDNSEKEDEEKAFSEKELELLEKDAQNKLDNPRVLMSLLAAETGMRVGELCALHNEDIGEEFIHVHRQQLREENKSTDSKTKYQHYEVLYTKDEKNHPHGGRYIPLTDKAREVINLASNIEGTSPYLFHDKCKSEMVTASSYSHNLLNRCKRLGCSLSNNHGFRMALNSRLISLGFEAADRALILGHEVQTNEAHYSLTDKRRLKYIKDIMTK